MASKTKTKSNDLDLTGFESVKKLAENMVTSYSTLRANQKECENAYFMDWQETPPGNLKVTISPDPHNKVRGTERLMTATGPKFNVPSDKNNPDARQLASIFEDSANAIWAGSNAIQGIVVEKDIAHCAALYGEMHMRIISTKDILDAARLALQNNKDPDKAALLEADVKHAEEINRRVSHLFEALDPMTCYVRRSRRGLEAHYQKIEVTVADVRAAYGGFADEALSGKQDYDTVELNVFLTRANVYVWISGSNEPIKAGPHGLSMIPVAYYSTDGSTIYTKPERQVVPMLYAVIKSGVWNRQNLFLTVTASNAAAMMNAQFIHEKAVAASEVRLNLSQIGSIVEIEPGDKLYPMAKEIINPALIQQYQMYDQLMDESTIFDQTLGQPIQGNPTYSANALLHQAGRLPLTPIQEGMAALFADAMSIAFQWLKLPGQGKTSVSSTKGETIEIEPAKIPDTLIFDVTVDVDLPADKLQQANIAGTLKQNALASNEWIRENILNIGQSDNEQSKIWREQMADLAAQILFPPFMQQMAVKMGLQAPPTQPTTGNAGNVSQGMGEQGQNPQTLTPPVSPIPSGMEGGGMQGTGMMPGGQ